MIYEKGIPEYAMVPAREAENRIIVPVAEAAVYTPVSITMVSPKQRTIITLEEDILVPDTRPDLKEILMIDGEVSLLTREIEQAGKGEDYVNLQGDIELQTLYIPEKNGLDEEVISIPTRLRFKERWNVPSEKGSLLTALCRIEKIDYMVINERKYRVKISLAAAAEESIDKEIDFFEGINGEEIQMLKEEIEITNVIERKKDTISISEELEIKEEGDIDDILMQNIYVAENYKQVTDEKIVVNGFVYVNLLYLAADAEGGKSSRQVHEKVEFTQFIPNKTGKDCAGSSIHFDGGNLKVKVVAVEDGERLRLEGDIVTYLELYSNITKEITIDGYHKSKEFICDYNEETARVLRGTAVGEAAVREIFSCEDSEREIDRVVYVAGKVVDCRSRCEAGKIVTEGIALVQMIFRFTEKSDENEAAAGVASFRKELPFRIVSAANDMSGDENICEEVYIRDIRAEKINGRQVEVNAVLQVGVEIMEEVRFKVLSNPAFEVSDKAEKRAAMIVYMVQPGETLWSIAKKFKTTVNSIVDINKLENEELTEGQKILII